MYVCAWARSCTCVCVRERESEYIHVRYVWRPKDNFRHFLRHYQPCFISCLAWSSLDRLDWLSVNLKDPPASECLPILDSSTLGFFFFFNVESVAWIQVLMLTRQVLYQLKYHPSTYSSHFIDEKNLRLRKASDLLKATHRRSRKTGIGNQVSATSKPVPFLSYHGTMTSCCVWPSRSSLLVPLSRANISLWHPRPVMIIP